MLKMEGDGFRSGKIEVIHPVATVRLKKLKLKEKELKRRIIVTHKLMMTDVKFLSKFHNVQVPKSDPFESMTFNTENKVFLATLDDVIDGMTDFFSSLPDVSRSSKDGESQELDAVNNLLLLGRRLEILILQLEYSSSHCS